MTKIKKQKLVVIGNGMAGMKVVEELRSQAPDMYDITVFGEEPYGNYNRILLSPVLAGEKTIDDIMLNDLDWYSANEVTLHTGCKVEHIDRLARTVTGDDGTVASYDKLLLATGSTPFILPVPGHDLDGVIGFRDVHDVEKMLDASKTHNKAVVIGGGLLGLEAANGLALNNMNVTVVHLMDRLMERQLDLAAGTMLRKSLEAKGLEFVVEAQTECLLGKDSVTGVKLKDGTVIDAELVVMAIGIKPNIELARNAGLHCERGVVVDDTLMTFDPNIYAVGECAQHRGVAYGLVAPLFDQARVCANHLVHKSYLTYKGSVTSTKLKVTGVDLFSAGDFSGGEGKEDIVLKDAHSGVYKKLVLNDNKIEGAVLYGDTIDGAWYFQLMRDGIDISDIRDTLLFGQAHLGDAGHGGGAGSVMSLSDDAEICGCNGVCKGDIVNAISEKKLFTLDDVRAHTKASSSCGSCTGLVEQLLANVLGGDYSASPAQKAMCGCTHYPHDVVRAAIAEQGLKTIPAVMKYLDWESPDGCASCRPALNYYLLFAWPGEYQDDGQSRFVNERVHGNIQKDGTYSVVPRMWGGLTTPQELRALADVAEKFEVPEVKVTGGQRIDLFGIEKQDLPAVWADLNAAGFVSGHAYGKALRTVKTCVGSTWCRFGTQDSTGLGVKLEQLAWGSWMPHKFKMAVSGCPRNCAEATIKDFGVVAVDSGYELHIGGNGGVKVRVTDLLCKVKTEDEVLEYSGAFMQLYRQQAWYLERTAPWVERVGFSSIKERIVEDENNRKTLYQQFILSQKTAQVDPWKERAPNSDQSKEFFPIKDIA